MAESRTQHRFKNTAINNAGAVTAGGLRIDFISSNGRQYYLAFNTTGNFKIVLFDDQWAPVWSVPM